LSSPDGLAVYETWLTPPCLPPAVYTSHLVTLLCTSSCLRLAPAAEADKRAARAEDRENANAARDAAREAQDKKDDKRRAREAEREEKERLREEEAAAKLAEEEKRKAEEYEKWREMFSVEGGGEDAVVEEEDTTLLARFVQHIKDRKVSTLEELAAEFKLKVLDVVDRVQLLERIGFISGVVDDRGKFIFISNEELTAVAKYIKKKGRVRISALAQESNKLIDLRPRVTDEEGEDEAAAEQGTGES